MSPAAKRRAVDMLKSALGMSERLACKAVGLARSTYHRVPIAQSPADPDAELRAWLRAYATAHPCHGFRRAWAALRHDEHRRINKKKVQRLWAEEGLQRRCAAGANAPVSPRTRRCAPMPPRWCGRTRSNGFPKVCQGVNPLELLTCQLHRLTAGTLEGDPVSGPVAMRLGVGGSRSTVERTRWG